MGQLVRSRVSPAPHTPLNVAISPHRRVAFLPAPLETFRAIKDAHGATVNDVVLAVTAGGIRAWMHSRGLRTEGIDMRAGVPVLMADHQLVQLVVPLPIDVADPVARLERIRAATAELKRARAARRAPARSPPRRASRRRRSSPRRPG